MTVAASRSTPELVDGTASTAADHDAATCAIPWSEIARFTVLGVLLLLVWVMIDVARYGGSNPVSLIQPGTLGPSTGLIASDFPGWVERMGATELPMTMAHAARAGAFTAPHRDPFDRMLAAQALLEAVPLVSRDAELDAFGVTRRW